MSLLSQFRLDFKNGSILCPSCGTLYEYTEADLKPQPICACLKQLLEQGAHP